MEASFGSILKTRRKALRFTQRALAEHVGVTVMYVTMLESGKRFPSPETAERFANALELVGEARQEFIRLARLRGGPVIDLPDPAKHFVGRDEELSSLRHVLLRTELRLLTLKGPPGVGKSALAVALAENVRSNFPGGVVFVDLASVSDPELALERIAQTCRQRLEDSRPREPHSEQEGDAARRPIDQRLDVLRDRQVLLILDTLEQLPALGTQLRALLRSFPLLKLLVTSRRELQVLGEQIVQVEPLGLPKQGSTANLEVIRASPAVTLFVDSAVAARSDFALTAQNCADVAAICLALSGLPLAIRLAAARCRHFAPAELRRRLAAPLTLLTDATEAANRHQTLRSALDWSYKLLSPPEQALFRLLGVFESSCPLEAIEYLAQGSAAITASAPNFLDLVATLLDHSLLQRAVDAADEQRYIMLTPVRSLAVELLQTSGEEEEIRRRKAVYDLSVISAATGRLAGSDGERWMRRLEADYLDLQATLHWAARRGESELVARLCHGLTEFWHNGGYWQDSRAWLEWVLSRREELPESLWAVTLRHAGVIARRQGDYEQARVLLEQYLAFCRSSGDQRATAFTLNLLGVVATARGDYTLAEQQLVESLQLWQAQGSRRNTSAALSNLALLADAQGEYDTALERYAQVLAIQQELNDRSGIARTLCNRGLAALHQGKFTLAEQLLEESLGLSIALNAPSMLVAIRNNLSLCKLFSGDLRGAEVLIRANLPICASLGDKRALTHALEAAACFALLSGQAQRGGRLFGAAKALRQRLRLALPNAERVLYASIVAQALHTNDQSAYRIAEEAGHALNSAEAVAEALGP